MARDPIFPLRLDADRRARWTDAAAREGCSLSEFIRRAVDDRSEAPTVAAAAAAASVPRRSPTSPASRPSATLSTARAGDLAGPAKPAPKPGRK